MKVLVTGSAGHLGEALCLSLLAANHEVVGLDIQASEFTSHQGSLTERSFVKRCMKGVQAVLHAATLHKPHVATHCRQDFVDTNITGTLNLLEEAVAAKVQRFVYTSTTSVFGDALVPPPGAPAAWITEGVMPAPKNIYGVTKAAAEDLCQLFHRNQGLPTIVLRTSRFFPEEDDRPDIRNEYCDENLKTNEYLFRRVDISDAVDAHLLALDKASTIGFGRFIISATSPFLRKDMTLLRDNAQKVVRQRVPTYEQEYLRRGWRMFPAIDRVYVNDKARRDLAWQPRFDFAAAIEQLRQNRDPRSSLARKIGSKGYHTERFTDGPYPVA
ncbi:NAD(P)-dependent oxidoreductase [Pelagibius sp. Alg239-R121]|uniref:NAD-dependent epimerase/dehydratase family protein n=1 Tax=Pelagibius sp. Alg239-R121 TaxID=2993448 RepID=UPI0024A6E6CE|nr:NAD(P)-dependent oxidoreductase [Pelagibius sp. Alg239-R121]